MRLQDKVDGYFYLRYVRATTAEKLRKFSGFQKNVNVT